MGPRWEPPTKGAVTQTRQRLGPEPMAELFSQVAEPVAGLEAEGAFLGPWRLMSVDGTELDVPDTPANREAFGTGANDGPFPKVRLVTVCECGSRAPVLAAMGPSVSKGSGEQSLPGPSTRGWRKAGCCSRTACSTAGTTGAPPPDPALTCYGG